MKRALIIFVCIIVICACSDKEYIQRFADIKYKGVDMEVKEFRIDGFYVESNKLEIDSLYHVVPIFYKDGTCVISFIKPDFYPLKKDKPINLSEEVLKWGWESQHWGERQGLFKINSDTIYVTVYDRDKWSIVIDRYKFKIIDSEHILLCLYERPRMKSKDDYSEKVNIEYTFVPADSIPIPDNDYLKKKKWFWENESDWKHYMESR